MEIIEIKEIRGGDQFRLIDDGITAVAAQDAELLGVDEIELKYETGNEVYTEQFFSRTEVELLSRVRVRS
jgi:hypothetical protein